MQFARIKNGLKKNQKVYFFIALFTQSSRTDSLVSFINIKRSCTLMTPWLVTGDCISQNDSQARRGVVFCRDEPGSLGDTSHWSSDRNESTGADCVGKQTIARKAKNRHRALQITANRNSRRRRTRQ